MVCVTQYDVVPGVLALGIGAVAEPTPPVALVYHIKLVPVAVNALKKVFGKDKSWQAVTLLTVGTAGFAFTVPFTATFTVLAPVEVKAILPEGFPVAEVAKRT